MSDLKSSNHMSLLTLILPRESVSEVEVQGLGSIADVNSASTSTFSASSQLIAGANRSDSVGNGNASAGASLSTSSYANQSNASTANAFMQAFTGGGQDLGVETITNVQTGDGGVGFKVTTEQVKTVETTYTTDASGNVN